MNERLIAAKTNYSAEQNSRTGKYGDWNDKFTRGFQQKTWTGRRNNQWTWTEMIWNYWVWGAKGEKDQSKWRKTKMASRISSGETIYALQESQKSKGACREITQRDNGWKLIKFEERHNYSSPRNQRIQAR